MARCCACLEKRLVPWASGRCLSWLELMSNTLMCMFFQPLKSMYRKRHGINVFLKTFIESPICICNRCLDLPGGTQENSIGQPSSNPQHTNKQERSTVFAQEDVHFKVEKDKRCQENSIYYCDQGQRASFNFNKSCWHLARQRLLKLNIHQSSQQYHFTQVNLLTRTTPFCRHLLP